MSKGTPAQGTRGKVLEAALHLFTTQGFDATPTAQISEGAGVSTGTLFHYFPSKRAVLEALYISIKKDMSAAIQSDDDPGLPTRQRMRLLFRSQVEWALDHPAEYAFLDQLYHSANISEEVRREGREAFQWKSELVKTALAEGLLKDGPVEFQLAMIGAIATGIINLHGRTEMTTEQMVDSGLALLLKDRA